MPHSSTLMRWGLGSEVIMLQVVLWIELKFSIALTIMFFYCQPYFYSKILAFLRFTKYPTVRILCSIEFRFRRFSIEIIQRTETLNNCTQPRTLSIERSYHSTQFQVEVKYLQIEKTASIFTILWHYKYSQQLNIFPLVFYTWLENTLSTSVQDFVLFHLCVCTPFSPLPIHQNNNYSSISLLFSQWNTAILTISSSSTSSRTQTQHLENCQYRWVTSSSVTMGQTFSRAQSSRPMR